MGDKRLLGQFFTITNPFELNVFLKWIKKIDNIENETIIEPFAGVNNIVEMIESIRNGITTDIINTMGLREPIGIYNGGHRYKLFFLLISSRVIR